MEPPTLEARRRSLMANGMRLAVVLLGAGLAMGPSDCSGGGGSGGSAAGFLAPAAKEIALEQAKIIFEFNQTDNDLGVQVFLDGESWKSMKITSPTGQVIFEVAGKGNLGKIGLSELFFEGDEPSLDEVPLA